MNSAEIQQVLNASERAVRSGEGDRLRALGFWRAVRAIERNPEQLSHYADQVGAIDRQAFEQSTLPATAAFAGVGILLIGALIATHLTLLATWSSARVKGGLLLAATGLLLVSTHDLAHFLVGRLLGIRFVGVFLGGPLKVQPGLKLDYASYLRAPPLDRAWMQAAGAIVTKVIPFLMWGIARAERAPRWATMALGALGAVMLWTDLLFSTRVSDWRRFRHQIRLARRQGQQAGSRG